MTKYIIFIGAFFGLLTVVLGAFGAHFLKEILLANDKLEVYKTAVQYQSIHALALLFIGLLALHFEAMKIRWIAYCMTFGIIIFSGSLYVLSLTSISIFGAITPIGGMLLIIGWVLLILEISKLDIKKGG